MAVNWSSDGPPEEVIHLIEEEFVYQSSLDLGDDTFEMVCARLPPRVLCGGQCSVVRVVVYRKHAKCRAVCVAVWALSLGQLKHGRDVM